MNHPVAKAAAILQSGLGMAIVIVLAGCSSGGSTAGSPRSESQVAEPTCYRDAKSKYESAGVSQNPNAALLNIGGDLFSDGDAFDKCQPALDRGNKIN